MEGYFISLRGSKRCKNCFKRVCLATSAGADASSASRVCSVWMSVCWCDAQRMFVEQFCLLWCWICVGLVLRDHLQGLLCWGWNVNDHFFFKISALIEHWSCDRLVDVYTDSVAAVAAVSGRLNSVTRTCVGSRCRVVQPADGVVARLLLLCSTWGSELLFNPLSRVRKVRNGLKHQ